MQVYLWWENNNAVLDCAVAFFKSHHVLPGLATALQLIIDS